MFSVPLGSVSVVSVVQLFIPAALVLVAYE